MIYKLQLSSKESIQISQEEFEKFKNNISSNFIEFKNGIVNPSFVICAVVDREATAEENKQLRWAEQNKQLSQPKNSQQYFEIPQSIKDKVKSTLNDNK